MNSLSTVSSAGIPDVAVQPAGPSVVPRRRSRSLSHELVESFTQKIRAQQFRPGDKLPTESAIMLEYGVSRTVVREAISRLQAGGLVDTQHGIGTFVLEQPTESSFKLGPGDVATATDVLAVLELRISLESESAGLAAQRRSASDLAAMRLALDTFDANVEQGGDTVAPDVDFHLNIARATGNRYFVDVMGHLEATLLPRARLNTARLPQAEQVAYLHRINQEHEQIYEAIARADVEGARAAMRMHLGNGRERQRRALEQAKASLPS